MALPPELVNALPDDYRRDYPLLLSSFLGAMERRDMYYIWLYMEEMRSYRHLALSRLPADRRRHWLRIFGLRPADLRVRR
jgi:hypothetical protein